MPDPQQTATAGRGFSLVMELEDPGKLADLMGQLGQHQPHLSAALAGLNYVHYARFLPLFRQGLLLIITEFDGDAADYVLDFAAVLDTEFSLILSFMKDRPPLPVRDHPREFLDYVDRNTRPPVPGLRYPEPFSAYPDRSVLEITGGAVAPKPPLPAPAPSPPIDLGDVQANLLRGFGATCALHFGLRFGTEAAARALLRELLQDGALPLTPAQRREPRPAVCVNVGLTFAGLAALGLPAELLAHFPQAFREGPAFPARAQRLGDEGRSAPSAWRIGGVGADGAPVPVHAMVSLYARDEGALQAPRQVLLQAVAALAPAVELAFEEAVQALDGVGTVHFGYRDGVAQPQFAGVHSRRPGPVSPPGDFLLGRDYVNSRGGRFIDELPPALAQNATYAALRVIEQDVRAFEGLLTSASYRHGIAPELVAAKLMGRWRDGSPLALNPEQPAPAQARHQAGWLDDFDYASRPASGGDPVGRHCPFGAHVRRLNPRQGFVVGVPDGRRVIRRGLPYGPAFDPARPDDGAARGLFGLFICGDLESQFEFLQHAWANGDLSAPGLRGTRDPFIGARGGSTPFRFHVPGRAQEIVIDVPPLTRTAGSLYLLMPGLGGLVWLAQAGWQAGAASPAVAVPASARAVAADGPFDPTTADFIRDPYSAYRAFRESAPVKQAVWPGQQGERHYWVFSRELVARVTQPVAEGEATVFVKPGVGHDPGDPARPLGVTSVFGDGLFFMDPPRHTEVRTMMNGAFADAIAGAPELAAATAARLLDAAFARGGMDLVTAYAGPLPMQVFMGVMGVPPQDQFFVDLWVRAALKGRAPTAEPALKLQAATAMMALRGYFLARLRRRAADTGAGCLIEGMRAHGADAACPAGQAMPADAMSEDEGVSTALNFALGGYLSTEFLIGTGVANLLDHPEQWQALKSGSDALLDSAVREMLRYDAPFQVAERWVENDTDLGGTVIPAQSIVSVVYGSANRDPALCADPDRFDITRTLEDGGLGAPHFGFGAGIHRCIGAPLALTVTKAALRALLERCAQPPQRPDATPVWWPDPYFRARVELKLSLA